MFPRSNRLYISKTKKTALEIYLRFKENGHEPCRVSIFWNNKNGESLERGFILFASRSHVLDAYNKMTRMMLFYPAILKIPDLNQEKRKKEKKKENLKNKVGVDNDFDIDDEDDDDDEITPIFVEGDYEIGNGFVGMERIVFLKICMLLGDIQKIRTVCFFFNNNIHNYFAMTGSWYE
jgi:hypothetical protein